jgi:hypothetical protein
MNVTPQEISKKQQTARPLEENDAVLNTLL